jgi:hypothetical protein
MPSVVPAYLSQMVSLYLQFQTKIRLSCFLGPISHKILTESETKIKRAILMLLNGGEGEQNFKTYFIAAVG